MSTTTQLTGLASGLDWRSLVDKLMAAERTPETRLRNQQTLFQQQSNLHRQLRSYASAFASRPETTVAR